MTLIEGIGDEVVQFVGLLLMVAVAALAWWSTNSQPGRYQTIVVMRTRIYHPVNLNIRSRIRQLSNANSQPAPAPPAAPPLMDRSVADPDASETGITVDGPVRFRQIALRPPPTSSTANPAPTPSPRAESVNARPAENSSRIFPILEMDNILDAHMAMIDEDRLHFYRRMDPPRRAAAAATEPAAAAASSDEQVREMEHIVSAMENIDDFPPGGNNSGASLDAAKTPKNDEKMDNNVEASASNIDAADDNGTSDNGDIASATNEPEIKNIPKINIRLKYMNDSLKEVEGYLDELLKDFKWRHFSPELSSQKRVRLIFNGRVLADEAASLRALGLHHRAVVHCHVQPGDTQARSPGEELPAEAAGGRAPAAEPERAWDLDNILMTLVSVALTVVWFFRCEYSNMFTASASVALFGLTVFYSVAIFGLYLSDTFHFDRRPAQPAPNN